MNRYTTQYKQSLEKRVVSIYGKVSFGASGAPALDKVNSKGIVSVTRLSAGRYKFVFGTDASRLDTYVKLLGVGHVFDASVAGAAPAAPQIYVVQDQVNVAGQCSLTIQLANAGTATDPALNEILKISFTMGDSTAP